MKDENVKSQSPKSDEEVETRLNTELPSEAEYSALTRDIFLRLLPTIYSPETLSAAPTGHTRSRIAALWLHAGQVAEFLCSSCGCTKANYEILRSRHARKLKFFS